MDQNELLKDKGDLVHSLLDSYELHSVNSVTGLSMRKKYQLDQENFHINPSKYFPYTETHLWILAIQDLNVAK